MICPKCKVNLNNDCKFCPRCGELFYSEDVDFKLNKFNLENKLLEVYFPPSKIQFNFYNISFGFLIGNFLYAFLKKVYDVAVISFLSFLLFTLMIFRGIPFIFESLGFAFMFVVSLILLSIFCFLFYVFKFNDLYLQNVKCRINRIIRDNPDKEMVELINICKEDNKKNYLVAFLSFLLMALLIFTLL